MGLPYAPGNISTVLRKPFLQTWGLSLFLQDIFSLKSSNLLIVSGLIFA